MYTQENQEPNMLLDDYENLTVHGKAKYESQILKEWGGSASRLTEEEFLLRQIPNLDSNWEKRQSLFVSRHCYKDQWAALDSGDKTYNQVQEEIRSRPRKRSKKVKPVQAEVEPQVTQVKPKREPKREPKAKKAAATLASLVAKVQRKTKARVKKEVKPPPSTLPAESLDAKLSEAFSEAYIKVITAHYSQVEETLITPSATINAFTEQVKDIIRAHVRSEGEYDPRYADGVDHQVTLMGIELDHIFIGTLKRIKKLTTSTRAPNLAPTFILPEVSSAFATLGVDPPEGRYISTEDLQRAKSAFKKIVKMKHPDKIGGVHTPEYLKYGAAMQLISQNYDQSN